MALFKNVGSIMKQNVSQNSASMMNSVRYMSTKLFVGGLSFGTDQTSLREAFSQYGEIADARVIVNRETGQSRGFGFVEFTDTEAANSAISGMDGQELHGRNISVNIAQERPAGPRGGGAGGGYSGNGYGAGGYSGGGGYNRGGGGGYNRGGSGGGGYQNSGYGGGDSY